MYVCPGMNVSGLRCLPVREHNDSAPYNDLHCLFLTIESIQDYAQLFENFFSFVHLLNHTELFDFILFKTELISFISYNSDCSFLQSFLIESYLVN